MGRPQQTQQQRQQQQSLVSCRQQMMVLPACSYACLMAGEQRGCRPSLRGGLPQAAAAELVGFDHCP